MTTGRMPDWLRRRGDVSRDDVALIAGGRQWTFAELNAEVDRTAKRLLHLGIGEDMPVAVLLANGPEFVFLTHAIGRTGAVMVPLNTRLTPAELAWQLRDVGARWLVYDGANADAARAIGAAMPDLPRASADGAGVDGDPMLPHLPVGDGPLREHIDLSKVHTVIYTSGTTGNPKGAQLTYGNHWWSATASALNLGLHPDDRWLACLPLFHVSGMSILMRSVIYGITAVVHERFDAARVNESIQRDRVTILSAVATMLHRMLDAQGERPYPRHLRCVLAGGGPVPRALLEECSRRNLPVVQTYGLTETASQVVTLAPRDALRKLGSAGKPLMPNELRIIGVHAEEDAEASLRPLPPYEIGEIVVRGPSVMAGYIQGRQVSSEGVRDKPAPRHAPARDEGWFRTGDLGYLDEDGYLYVVDRRDDLVISGGENVYPAEVEAALSAHPAVAEAGVTGLPDPHWGQIVVAAVTLRPGKTATAAELQRFCSERLARYKVPRHVKFVDTLPRNAAGKLLRRALAPLFHPSLEKENSGA